MNADLITTSFVPAIILENNISTGDNLFLLGVSGISIVSSGDYSLISFTGSVVVGSSGSFDTGILTGFQPLLGAGFTTISGGLDNVTVNVSSFLSSNKIWVTPLTAGPRVAYLTKNSGNFNIQLDGPAFNDMNFDWFFI